MLSMPARSWLVSIVGASVLAPSLAAAQSSAAPGSTPSGSPAGDTAIEITAPAPVGTTAVDAPVTWTDGGDPEAAYQDSEPDDEEMVTVRRRPVVDSSRAAIEAVWRRHLGIGLTTGVGSPIGIFGAFAELNVHPAFGITFGGGAGGTFGPSIALGVLGRPFRFGPFAPFAGLSFSTNFTPAQYRSDPSLAAAANSYWLDLELGGELRFTRGFGLRLGVGWAVMLNTGDFTNQQVGPQYGPLSNVQIGWDPVSAADSHDEGHALGFPFVHLDAVYHFPF